MNSLHEARRLLLQRIRQILSSLEQNLEELFGSGQCANPEAVSLTLKKLSAELELMIRFVPDRKKHAEAEKLHKLCVLLAGSGQGIESEESLQLLISFYQSAAFLSAGE